ncbi:hypothetical protein HK097_010564 [Rhizophlyctis rosea]|uniref:ATP synthase F(0) complex subunit e, mitochondrial n=1 Tax=Rhizophlyctis rosea TaxID=64517 RepID=A0AAD5X0E0_9FUNG|nr:hypothetical protein HK097_010564 [Rhizophlyctis rosea]
MAAATTSIININAANLLRIGAFGTGIFYGFSRKATLTQFVKDREHARHEQLEDELIEEGKVAFEAQFNREQAKLAKRDGVASVDSDSYKFDAERYINWLINQTEKDADKPIASGQQAKEAEKKLGK